MRGTATSPAGPRARRFSLTWTRVVVALVVVCALVAGLTARLFVWPQNSSPRHVDAVIVPAGDYGERLAKALSLIQQGVTSTLVMVGEPDSVHVLDLCKGGQPFEVICMRPRPDSTRYEARASARLASERGWTKVAVVTSTGHLTRAGLLFRRCMDASVVMVEGRLRPTPRFIVHEWLGLADALILARGC